MWCSVSVVQPCGCLGPSCERVAFSWPCSSSGAKRSYADVCPEGVFCYSRADVLRLFGGRIACPGWSLQFGKVCSAPPSYDGFELLVSHFACVPALCRDGWIAPPCLQALASTPCT